MKKTYEINGTCFQGDILITFAELVQAFGYPHTVQNEKTTAEWAFRTDDGVVFTIYDYYNISTPEDAYRWHIGGHSPLALEAVRALFPNREVKK